MAAMSDEPTAAAEGTLGQALKDHKFTRDDELNDALSVPPDQPIPAEVTPEVDASESSLFDGRGGAPEALVRWGTFSSAHDKKVKEEEADAEARRNEAAEELAEANKPIEHGGARIHGHEFSDSPEVMKAYVPLTYVSRNGKEVLETGYGDITQVVDPAFEGELAVHIICLRCKERLPQGQCILTIRQSNRHWELDPHGRGDLFIFEERPMQSAGTIRDGERFTCPRCSWQGRIDNNKVWPD